MADTLPCALCDSDIPAAATVCPWCKGDPGAERVPCPARCDGGRVATGARDALESDWTYCDTCDGESTVEAPYAHLREEAAKCQAA